MNKKGLSHVEVILGFLIFVSAVIFIFYVFDIGKATVDNESLALYAFNKLKKNATSEVIIYSIKLKVEDAPSEINQIAIELPEEVKTNFKIRAENYTGSRIDAKIDENNRKIVYIAIQDENDNFVRILLSEDIKEEPSSLNSGTTVFNDLYEIISQENSFLISEKKLREIQGVYNSVRYSSLKNELGLPNKYDFGFYVGFSEGDFIKAENNIPTKREVFSKSTRSEILRENGERVFADFVMKLW